MKTIDDMKNIRFRAFHVFIAQQAGDADQLNVQLKAVDIECLSLDDVFDEVVLIRAEFGGKPLDVARRAFDAYIRRELDAERRG